VNRLKLIDSHCHIEESDFDEDRTAVINRAAASGVYIISSAISKGRWKKCLEVSRSFDNVYCSLGFDPVNLELKDSLLDWIRHQKDNIVAIGEVGMDHYRIRDHSERDLQLTIFLKFIELSKQLQLPLQVHSRSAGRKALDVLRDSEAVNVHLHAFDGAANLARVASRELGYYFSIPASVIRSRQKQKLTKAIEIERLLLETDSPVLGPENGVRNEPSNIWVALREVAQILKRQEEELRQIIIENTLRLYTRIRPQ
jgi:TatD DNase family protein